MRAQEQDSRTAGAPSTQICSHVSNYLAVQARHSQLPTMPVFHNLPDFLAFLNCTMLSGQIRVFLDHAYQNWSVGRPVPRDLPTLSRLNAFDALVRNAQILQIPVEALASDDIDSPMIVSNECLPVGEQHAGQFPVHLSPTILQQSVVHHAWLDLFPFPNLRDRILRGIHTGELDEDTVCDELCCELLNLESTTDAPVVVWGESWKASSWEFSPAFIEKWASLLQDCPEILIATNYWRRLRGDRSISSSSCRRRGSVPTDPSSNS